MRFFYEFFFVFFSYNLKNKVEPPFETALLQISAAFFGMFILGFFIIADLFNLERLVYYGKSLILLFCFLIYLYIRYLTNRKLKIDKGNGLCERYVFFIRKRDKIFYWSVFLGFTLGIPFLYSYVKFYL